MTRRMKKGPPAEKPKRIRRSPQDARAHILEAAIRVISQKGPDAVGLKDVAQEAGVSHALITHYFKTYDGLVDEAVTASVDRLRQRLIDTALSGKDVTLEGLLRMYLDSALEAWYGRLVSFALLSDHEGATSEAARISGDMRGLVTAIEKMLAQRINPPPPRADVEMLIVATWSIAIGYVAGNAFIWRSLGRTPGPRKDREFREALAGIARGLFQAPLAPPAQDG